EELGDQEWPAFPPGIGKDAALQPQLGEALGHLGLEVALELGLALGVLALGRDGDAPGEVGVEAAGVEILLRGGNGGLSGHGVIDCAVKCRACLVSSGFKVRALKEAGSPTPQEEV